MTRRDLTKIGKSYTEASNKGPVTPHYSQENPAMALHPEIEKWIETISEADKYFLKHAEGPPGHHENVIAQVKKEFEKKGLPKHGDIYTRRLAPPHEENDNGKD
jgi:hypothetical protein